MHTALTFPLVGEDVLITGAGPIGLMAIAVARHAGARKIAVTDVSAPRLELARQLGVDLAIDVSRMRVKDAQRELGMREGFDIGMEMSGHPAALPEMIENMNHGGRIAMLGLPSQSIDIDWGKVVTHMLTLKGIYGREMFETWYAMSAMLSSNPAPHANISPWSRTRFPATRLGEGLRRRPRRRGGKVVLDWTGSSLASVPDHRPTLAEEPPMYSAIKDQLQHELDEIRSAGLFKTERHIDSPAGQPHQGRADRRAGARRAELLRQQLPGPRRPPGHHRRGQAAMDERGFGMASVRFICGTQDLHLALETPASRRSSAPRTPSCSPAASTPTAACSSPSSARKTPSSPTR